MTEPKALHSQEAEEAVLGAIFIDPDAFIEADSILRSDKDFFFLRNRLVYTAMTRVKSRGDYLDAITIADDLESTGDLDNIGGRAFLMQLANSLGTSQHVSVYAALVKRAAVRRDMLAALDTMRVTVYDESINIEDVKSKADGAWLKATSDVTESQGAWIDSILSDVYDDVEKALQSPTGITGISTGLKEVDELMLGFEPEQLIILAGRPGMGKSAAMDNMALSIAKSGTPLLYATSERSKKEVVMRMAAIHCGINSRKLRNGKLTPDEARAFTQAIGDLSKLPIYIEDTPMPRPRDIHSIADWMIKRHGCEIVLFDGMYRAHAGVPELDRDSHKKYGTIARDLKTMARALHVPVLATHQLNRALEQRQDKRPMMSDLRESGTIEEEADKIIFLYRDEVYNEATDEQGVCHWIVSKHRNGATGTAFTHFDAQYTRFSNLDKQTYILD